MSIRVSIVIPVYHVERFIKECLLSVMNQTYSNFECLIVDDCGCDNSISIAKELIAQYRGKAIFRIIYRSNNGGLSAARNSGIDAATGDYIYFLDSDDYLYHNAIELLVNMVDKYPGVDMVQGNMVTQDNSKCWQLEGRNLPEYNNNKEWIRHQMLTFNIGLSAWNKLIRFDYIRQYKLRFFEGVIHEDVMWCFTNQKYIQSVAFVFEPCYWYRTKNEFSIMNNKDKTYSILSSLEIYKQIVQRVETVDEKRFIYYFLDPYNKLIIWNKVNRSKVVKEIRKAVIILFKSKISFMFLCNLLFWFLPCWVIKTSFFAKIQREIIKYYNCA